MENTIIPPIKGRRIFITGGAGFIGSTLIGRLIAGNHITVYDDFRRDSLSGKAFANDANLRVVKGDVLDYASLSNAIADWRSWSIAQLSLVLIR